MSREIKFRAYDGYGNMEYFKLTSTDWLNIKYVAETEPVMEFTGIEDSGGQDIFEGDILKVDWCEFHSHVWDADTFEVKFHHASFCIENVPLEPPTCDRYEVVGNVHQHPHLLESA